MVSLLFADYDGVLHRGNSYITERGIVSSAPGEIELFEFAPLLAALLEPYCHVQIVLSTDWVMRFGFTQARDALPTPSLRQRVGSATYDPVLDDPKEWTALTRGAQILRYVKTTRATSWLAIDDRLDGLRGYHKHLVHCQSEYGLGDSAVVNVLRNRLAEQFGRCAF